MKSRRKRNLLVKIGIIGALSWTAVILIFKNSDNKLSIQQQLQQQNIIQQQQQINKHVDRKEEGGNLDDNSNKIIHEDKKVEGRSYLFVELISLLNT